MTDSSQSSKPLPAITVVAGARPNFMKIAPIVEALRGRAKLRFVHTGQHYDSAMSDSILRDLNLPSPDCSLGVGSGSHALQTARIMTLFEPEIVFRKPKMLVVVGDVNSTLACALVAAKEHVAVAHVEAGLRSGDLSMPEEVNRVVTDRLSTLLLTPSEDADENLLKEGHNASQIRRVGNTMIDSLLLHMPRARDAAALLRNRMNLPSTFGVVTLHRPSNVDDAAQLSFLLDQLGSVSRLIPLVLPLHPRTEAAMARHGLKTAPAIRLCGPLSYLEFVGLMQFSSVVLTDSGGVQEEAAALGIPCLTLRDSTERPVTCLLGSNRLVGSMPSNLEESVRGVLNSPPSAERIPLWDGRAGLRCADAILEASESL